MDNSIYILLSKILIQNTQRLIPFKKPLVRDYTIYAVFLIFPATYFSPVFYETTLKYEKIAYIAYRTDYQHFNRVLIAYQSRTKHQNRVPKIPFLTYNISLPISVSTNLIHFRLLCSLDRVLWYAIFKIVHDSSIALLNLFIE